jgi:outer membrane protein OmpA-like peptidoglycan-associated protein
MCQISFHNKNGFSTALKRLVSILLISALVFPCLFAQYEVDANYKLEYLVKTVFLGSPEVNVSNITFTGANHSLGFFKYPEGKLGMNDGLLLTTGSIYGTKGPNNSPIMGLDNNRPGDPLLTNLAGKTSYDAVSLEFDFFPVSDRIELKYVFASEEYLEYVNRGYNDVFGFFLSGPGITGQVNLAKVPDTEEEVSVNSINDRRNSQYYIDNGSTLDPRDKSGELKSKVFDNRLQWDGLTTVLTASHKVTPYGRYRIKVVIADAGDGVVDSGVYLKAKSFKSVGTPVPPPPGFRVGGKTVSPAKKKALPRDIVIEFDFDSADIPDTSRTKLYYMYKDIRDYREAKLEVKGHTDFVGSEGFNQGLSERRVNAVVNYLIRVGYPRSNIVVYEGFGEKVPKTTNETDEGRQRNRRVEVKVLWNFYAPK